jgi:adenosylcobinamide amidohydrolase
MIDMTVHPYTGISGVHVAIDDRAVHVTSELPLLVLSSAVVGGGFSTTRHIVNMHVHRHYDGGSPADDLAAFAAEAAIPEPFVGVMTAAHTEHARVAAESRQGLSVAAVVSLGLSNTSCAGITPVAPLSMGTINAIVIVDRALAAAAMVNLVITITEAKTMELSGWDVRTSGGELASGTSTDTVVVASTATGAELQYAGPATLAGWLAARAVRRAIARICREKLARDGGLRAGW